MSKPKKILTNLAHILNFQFHYENRDKFEEKIKDFKAAYENQWCEITFKIVDKAFHYMHKYYRGEILKPLAQSLDAKDFKRIHTQLKAEFMTIEIDGYSGIPDIYMEIGIAVVREDQLYQVNIPSRRTIVKIDDQDQPCAIIPSHASYTQDEMKEFIKYAESVRDNMIEGWRISDESKAMREEFMGEQGEMF